MADDEVTMKIFRKLLRYWIGIASVLSFLGGWVILAHSPKPVQLQSTSPVQPIALPSLPPIQAYGATTNNGPTFFSTTGPTCGGEEGRTVIGSGSVCLDGRKAWQGNWLYG